MKAKIRFAKDTAVKIAEHIDPRIVLAFERWAKKNVIGHNEHGKFSPQAWGCTDEGGHPAR